jgi:hypothetical protein
MDLLQVLVDREAVGAAGVVVVAVGPPGPVCAMKTRAHALNVYKRDVLM